MTALADRILDARPDSLDFRDQIWVPTLVEVPLEVSLEDYRELGVPILDQGKEGACTGFGLATVANFLLRRRRVRPDDIPVSPRMFYEMARRYDEWQGEDYEGSSARGAMKGWHRHGVCGEEVWPYQPSQHETLTDARAKEARKRPLGAYYRVNHRDIVSMHSAIAEVGILYTTAMVHEGWDQVADDGEIPFSDKKTGGHAFAVVAYDDRGFWIQNSWGADWGHNGFALITYDDWLRNATDAWAARLGAPIKVNEYQTSAVLQSPSAGESDVYAFAAIRPHVISIGNDGILRGSGTYGTTRDDVQAIFDQDIPRVTSAWPRKRVLLYAHGGLVTEGSAIQRVADYRAALLEKQIYPLAFVWKSDFWTTLANILDDALGRRRDEGIIDDTKDFMLDRLDDALEPIARSTLGKTQWDEMKENALGATTSPDGGARFTADLIKNLVDSDSTVELHLLGHSAGAIFNARLAQLLTTSGSITGGPRDGTPGLGLKIKTCTLWAPACSISLFDETYLPAIQSEAIEHFTLVTLRDSVERDDHCANIYHKSLLYLVSNAFERLPRIPLFRDGEPLLGMERFVEKHDVLQGLFDAGQASWITAPNSEPVGSPKASTARHHGGFDDDVPTARGLLARVLDEPSDRTPVRIQRSESFLRDRRQQLTQDV